MWAFPGAEGSGPGVLGHTGRRGLSGWGGSWGKVSSPLPSSQHSHAAKLEGKSEGGLGPGDLAGVCLCEVRPPSSPSSRSSPSRTLSAPPPLSLNQSHTSYPACLAWPAMWPLSYFSFL